MKNLKLVTYVRGSKNGKIGSVRNPKARVDSTYVSIEASCPSTCPLKESGECYGKQGHVGFTERRLSKGADSSLALEAAKQHAAAMDAAYGGGPVPQDGAQGGRDLRLRTIGDATTTEAARLESDAVERLKARGLGAAWGYTHAFRTVTRNAWGRVSILASVDAPSQASEAYAAGYAPAVYLAAFPSEKAFELDGHKWIPCPAQTRDDTGCADCRLCMNAEKLFERRTGIAFAAHGVKEKQMKRRLSVVAS